MPSTPTYALPYPASTNVPDVPTDLAALCNRIEVAIAPGTATGQIPVWDNTAKTWGPAARVGYATTLPASPYDGQEAILVDSITTPTFLWRLRYNAGSTATYKWEFIGGLPLYIAGGSSNITTTTPTAIAGLGTWTVARTGDYRIIFGAYVGNTAGFTAIYYTYVQLAQNGTLIGLQAVY